MNDRRQPSVPPRIGVRARLEAGAADRLARVLGDLRMPIEHLLHVAVRLLDRDLDARAGIARPPPRAPAARASLPCRFSPAVAKSRTSSSHRRALDAGLDHVRMHEALVAVGRLRRQRVVRQAVDEVGGDLDRVDHPALRVAGMRVEAVKGHRHRVGGEALDLDLAAAAAVHRVGAARAEPRDVEVLGAAADLLVGREARCGSGRAGSPGCATR